MEKLKTNKESAEVVALKEGARRMQDFFASQGIKVKHSQSLEALTTSLGLANWRTLQAKLNAPTQAIGASVLDPNEPRWMVCAVYDENNQRYAQSFDGESALEAQILAQFDRLADYNSITIISVIDKLTGDIADVESFTGEVDVLAQSKCIAKLCEKAKKNLGAPPKQGIDAAEEFDKTSRALEFWTEVCCPAEKGGALAIYQEYLDELVTDPDFDVEDVNEGNTLLPMFTDCRGVNDPIDPQDALNRVVALAKVGLDMSDTYDAKKTGVFYVLQTEVFLGMYGVKAGALFLGEEF